MKRGGSVTKTAVLLSLLGLSPKNEPWNSTINILGARALGELGQAVRLVPRAGFCQCSEDAGARQRKSVECVSAVHLLQGMGPGTAERPLRRLGVW